MFFELQEWITILLVSGACFIYVAYLGIILPKLLPETLSDFTFHFKVATKNKPKFMDSIVHISVCVLDLAGIVIILGLVFTPFIIMAIQ